MRARLGALSRSLYRSALPFVPILVALLIFQSPLLLYGFCGVAVLFLLRWFTEGAPLPSTPANLFLLVLLSTLMVGMVNPPSREDALRIAAHVLAGVLIFFTIQDWAWGIKRLWWFAALLVMLGVAFALVAPFTTVWLPFKLFQWSAFYDYPFPRFGELSVANNVAGGLEPVVPLAFALIGSGRWILRLIGVFSLPILIVMLVLLQSRSALLAIGIGFTVYLVLHRRWFMPLIPLTLLGGLYLYNLTGRVLEQDAIVAKNMSSAPERLQERFEIWHQILLPLLRSPMGLGLGGFKEYAETHLADVLSEQQRVHAHNLFLEVGADLGVVGLGAFIGLWFVALRAAWSASNALPTRELAIGIVAALAVILTHGMFDLVFWGAKPGIMLWAILGMAIALSRCATVGTPELHPQNGFLRKLGV